MTYRAPVVYRGLALHVDGCPIPARIWKGKPYANVMDDCSGCTYFRGDESEPDDEVNEEYGAVLAILCTHLGWGARTQQLRLEV